MADGDREGVSGVRRRRLGLQPKDRLHHLLHLLLLGPAIAADHLLDAGRRILSALDAGVRGRDHDGPARPSDGECGAGVDADEGFLEDDGIRPVRVDERDDRVEDRLQALLGSFSGLCFPPPVVDGPETPVALVDDAEPARSRPWIDADDLHAVTLGGGSDVSSLPISGEKEVMPANTWLTFPDGTEHALSDAVTIGRDTKNDLTLSSPAVSREHALLTFREGRWFVEDRGSYNGTFLNGTRVQPGTPLPLRHADRIGIGTETVLFSWPSQVLDPDKTETLEEIEAPESAQLSSFQRQVVQCLCARWLAGASLENLPSNEEIAAELGTPGATGTVKAALRRIYAKAGLSDQPAHAKRRTLCRLAREKGWI
jgi:FHA domain